MRWPERIPSGASIPAMVMNIDFAPTFLELAGLEPPADLQGRSLSGVIAGRTPADWRRSIYYHYYEYPGFHAVKRHYGVRTDRYKLIHFYHDIDAWEFYDLETDPLELHNRIDDPDYRDEIAHMRAELESLRTQYRVPPDKIE
jgi:arylsulfatase A-like enzyme